MPQAGGYPEGAHGRAPLRLLLVEPDPRAALWIGEMLRMGWEQSLVLAHAERVADALDDLATAVTDCVVLDVSGLVESDWLVAVQQIRGEASNVPIVVFGDTAGDDAAVAALRSGAEDYLHRPELGPNQLRRAIRYAIERKRAEVQLTHRALHDSVTGLPNRALFLDRLGVALERSRRSGARVAVLFLDVDNFKDINDSRGHAAGDQLLIELSERLRTMLRPMDTVARFGGDEFTFLFEDLHDEREVVIIAERIARACRVPIAVDHAEVTITVSMGIAMVTDPRTSPDTVIREADAAMYRAKERGGGRYELFDERTRERALERLELERALRRALADGQLRVHYQATYSLCEPSAVVGLEALLRWHHPERGLICAQEFIGLAEETGLVVELGQYVLGEVLGQLAHWRAQRPDISIAVNLSQRELEDIGLPGTVASALRNAGVSPDALWLEIAEPLVARSPTAAARVLRTLKEIGVHTTIDDFGTGATSVLALRRLPVDALKIHQSLLGHPGEAAETVGAVVGLAHGLGMRVVAEGVETDAQAEQARAAGCDGAQGYLFARPVPGEEVESLLDPADGEVECTLH